MSLPGYIANSTLPQWVTAISSTGLFMAAARFVLQWRGQSLTSEEQVRDHYAKEVARLTEKLEQKDEAFLLIEGHWRDMLDASDKRHEECEDARRELRKELDRMHDEIRGLKVQIREASTDRLMVLEGNGGGMKPSDIAPHATASAGRMKKQTRKGPGDDGTA